MAGHSKWANIKHKKARQDARRGKVFSRLGREIMMAAREGGGNPETNFRLRLAIDRAKTANLPADNIQRAIQRGTGEVEGAEYEQFTYEGYGPGGVAIMVELMTDNRNRTAGEIRYLFTKQGGNLGEVGCVSWMFQRVGQITVPSADVDEDELMLLVLDAGADDMKQEGDQFVIHTTPDTTAGVVDAIAASGIDDVSADITFIPTVQTRLEGEQLKTLLVLLDALEDHDDVQNMYANLDITDEELQQLEIE